MAGTTTGKYRIKVKGEQVGSLVGINDAPIIADPRGKGIVLAMPVNEWIIPNYKNEFTATLTMSESMQKEEFEEGVAAFSAQVFRVNPQSQTQEPAKVLDEFNWPINGIPERYPFPYRKPVEIDPLPPATKLWSEAQRLEKLTPDDKNQIFVLVDQIIKAFQNKDVGLIYDYMRYKLDDYCRAYEMPIGTIEQPSLDQYGKVVNQDEMKVIPCKPELTDLRLVCDNRVVLVSQGTDMRAIIVDGKKYKFSQMLYLSRIEDKWVVVR